MAVIGVSMIALIVVTILLVVGFLVVVMFVGDIFVAGAVVSLALLVMGAGLFLFVTPTVTFNENVVVHGVDEHSVQTRNPPTTEKSPDGETKIGAQITHVVEPDSGPMNPATTAITAADPNTLSTTSGLYATTDLALNDALTKLAAKLDEQMPVPRFVSGAEAQMVQILKSEQSHFQVHDTAAERDLGDGLVARMHQVTVNFPLDLMDRVREQMEQWVSLMRARQVFIVLGSAAAGLFVIGAFLSWISRPAKPARTVEPS